MTGGKPPRAVVIGAGLAGLSAAHRLSRRGWDVLVLEREAQAGGRCRTVHTGGFGFDTGAQHIRDSFDSTLKTAIEAGLGAGLRIPEERKGIFHDGEVRTFFSRSKNPTKLVPWQALGPGGAFGLAAVVLSLTRRYRSYNVRFPEWWEGGDDITASEFLSRRMNEATVCAFALPVALYGLGAGPDEVSAAAFLAALRFTLADRTGSFTGGMGSLPAVLSRRLDIRFAMDAVEVVVEERRAVGVSARPAAGGRSRRYRADLVVCAIPAHDALEVTPGIGSVARGVAVATRYSPGIVVNLGFGARVRGVPGPVLLPGKEGFKASWVCTNASKAAEYAPDEGSVVTVVFCGAAAEELLGGDDESVVASALGDAARVLPLDGAAPAAVRVDRHPFAKPVAAPGHARRVRELATAGSGIRGLVLAGDWTSSPTVEGAVRSGLLAADRDECTRLD